MNTPQKLKVAFLSAQNPKDISVYSGCFYYMVNALLQNGSFDITFVTLLTAGENSMRSAVHKATEKSLLKKKLRFLFTLYNAVTFARAAEKKLNGQHFDFIVAPAAARELAFLKTKIPVVYISDNTWGLLINYLMNYKGLTSLAIMQGNMVERKAIKKSSLLFFASQWAANSAINKYGADANKVEVLNWGANVDNIPPRETVLARRLSTECNLLFVGTGWERKGGQIAFDTLLELEKLGINARLTICGCQPPENSTHPRLTVFKRLNKNDEQQRKQFEQLYLSAGFFILPTRAECYGAAFCEAAAFALPVIATDTGGISSIVKQNVTGYLLPYEAGGDKYAQAIKDIYSDKDRYIKMAHAARERFENTLNWDVFANKLAEKLYAYKNAHTK